MGDFLDYDNWDEPGKDFSLKFTEMQWSITKYLAYMAFSKESDNEEISDVEMIEKFIKKLIENELHDPKLQGGPKLEQQSLFVKND